MTAQAGLALAAMLLLVQFPVVASNATMSQARRLAAEGKWADAERLLIRLSAAEPGNFAAHLLLGEARYKQGKLTLAADNLLLARALRPDSPAAAQLLGYVRFAQQNYTQAASALKSAVDLGGSDAITYYRLGLAFERTGQLRRARDCLQQGALRHSQDVPTVATLARLESRLGRHSEAAYWYRRAVALRPQDNRLFREMLDAHMAAGDYLGAQAALQAHLDKNPDDVQAWRKLAETYEKLSLPLQARAVYMRLEQMGKLTERERRALLDGYLREGRWAEAIAQYEKLQVGADATLCTAIGQAYANLQMWKPAIAALQKAVSTSRTADRVRLLADVYYTSGHYSQAHELYSDLLTTQADAELLTMAAAAALRSGHSQTGLNLLKRLVATRPDDYSQRRLAAETAEQVGQLNEALAQWYVAEQLPGTDADEARLALAHVAYVAGYHDWALQWLGKLNCKSLSARQLEQAARLAHTLDDQSTAQAAAESLLARADTGPELQAMAAELLMRYGSSQHLQAVGSAWERHAGDGDMGLVYARWLIREQNYVRTVEVCRKALGKDPDGRDLYLALIEACEQLQQPEMAVSIIEELITDAGPNSLSADFLRVAHEQATGREAAAVQMKALLSRYPDDPAVLVSAARALEKTRNYVEAAALYEKLIARQGGSAGYDAALCYVKAGSAERARQIVAANLPVSSRAQEISGMISLVPLDVAMSLLTVEPESVEAFLMLARVYVTADKTQQGLTFFEALATEQGLATARSGKAYLLSRSGQYTEALVELGKLPEDAMADPHVKLLLAECHLGSGNLAPAMQIAAAVSSDDPVMLLRAAEIVASAALQAGDSKGALAGLTHVLRIAPGSIAAAQGLQTLCSEGVVSLPEVRRALSDAYRHAADPTPLLLLASDLATVSDFEGLTEWVDSRKAAAEGR